MNPFKALREVWELMGKPSPGVSGKEAQKCRAEFVIFLILLGTAKYWMGFLAWLTIVSLAGGASEMARAQERPGHPRLHGAPWELREERQELQNARADSATRANGR